MDLGGEIQMWWLLFFIPLMLILYYLGIATSNIGASIGITWGLPSWWRGKYSYLSGIISRNFRTHGYPTMHIEIETISGDISLEIRDYSGNTLYAWGCISDLEVNIDIEENEKISAQISASNFKGQFFLSLEK